MAGDPFAELRAAVKRYDDAGTAFAYERRADVVAAARALVAAHPEPRDEVQEAWNALYDAVPPGNNTGVWAARNRPDLLRALADAGEREKTLPWWQIKRDEDGLKLVANHHVLRLPHEAWVRVFRNVLRPELERKEDDR